MPKGPQGQKRHADEIGNAVHVMRKPAPLRFEITDGQLTEGLIPVCVIRNG